MDSVILGVMRSLAAVAVVALTVVGVCGVAGPCQAGAAQRSMACCQAATGPSHSCCCRGGGSPASTPLPTLPAAAPDQQAMAPATVSTIAPSPACDDAPAAADPAGTAELGEPLIHVTLCIFRC